MKYKRYKKHVLGSLLTLALIAGGSPLLANSLETRTSKMTGYMNQIKMREGEDFDIADEETLNSSLNRN